MSGGLKCNPYSVSLVTIGTLLAIVSMFAFVLVNVPLDFDTCEDETQEDDEIVYHGIVIRVTEPPIPQPELFSWSYDENRTLSKVQRLPYSCHQSLNSPSENDSKRNKFLKACLDAIGGVIPKNHDERSLVYLIAEDQTNGDNDLDALRETLAQYPFNTSQVDFDRPATVIADDIARYRWIAENQELGTIRSESEVPENNMDLYVSTRPTRGIVEIGPCSVSITFALADSEDDTETLLEYGNRTRIYSREYMLYTRNYPYYGLSQADSWYKKQLVLEMTNSNEKTIPDPCAPSGSYDTISFPDDISGSGSPCTDPAPTGKNLTTTPVDEAVATRSNQGDYTLVGTGDSEECQQQLNVFIREEGLGPDLHIDLTAMALFLSLPIDFVELTAMDNGNDAYCNRTDKPTEKPTNATGINSCFLMTYMRALVVEGLKIDKATWEQAVITMTDITSDVRWIHGFMTSTISSLQPPPRPCTLTEENRRAMERKQKAVTALIVLMLGGFCTVGLGYGLACRRGEDNWMPSPLVMYQLD